MPDTTTTAPRPVMAPDEYIAQRVDAQTAWYGRRSARAKRNFRSLRIIEIVGAAVIPLLAGFLPAIPYGSFVVAIVGVIVAVCAALLGLGHYQEDWAEYRTTTESIKHQKFLFLTGATPYDTDQAFSLFVQCVEGLISKENTAWSQHVRAPPKSDTARRESRE